MAASVNQAKIVIPTGYETQQRGLDRRSAIAQALLERGIAGPGANATSWTQPLASIVQAFLGKRLQDKVEGRQDELNGRLKADYSAKVAEVQQDIINAGNDPRALQQVWFKHQDNPLVAEILKPVGERVSAAQRSGDSPTDWGPYRVSNRDAMALGQKPNDPNANILRDNAGNGVVNEAAITRALLAQNMVPSGAPPMTVQDPLGSPEARLAALRASQDAGGAPIPPPLDMTQAELPALPQNFAPPKGQIEQTQTDPSTGRPYYKIQGQWYDNPEGR